MTAPFYLKLIGTLPDGSRDAAPLLARGSALAALCGDLLRGVEGVTFDAVAGIEGLGFVIGAAMATRAGAGFIALRAADPQATGSPSAEAPRLALRKRAASPGLRVLLVDDWIVTGASALEATALLEGQGARVVAVAAIGVASGEGADALMARTRCVSVWPSGLEIRGVIKAPDTVRSGSVCGAPRPPGPSS